MEAQLGPCLPPLSCHPGVEWTVPEVGLGLLFLLTGLVLGRRPHPHPPHQFEMASKTHRVKMSGKADSTSIRFLTCRLQSHTYRQPRRIPANWPETKAEVDPTEEKGAPHPFLPSRGDLCLLRSTQAPKLLLLLLFENCTPLLSICHAPPRESRREERKLRRGSLRVGVGIGERSA